MIAKDFLINPRALAQAYFGIDLTPMQEDILKTILMGKHKRIVISAMTRYGKSLTVAMAILLYAVLNDGKRNTIVAPRDKQAKILMNYIANFIVTQPRIGKMVDITATGIDRLKKEVTKSRVTFKNGSEIDIISAEGSAERLLGHGVTGLLVLDESAWITDEVYRSRITRMLGDTPDTILVKIGNPFNHNHFYESWKDPKYKRFHIDWRLALKEERITQAFVDEQRALLTPMEFQVLYSAEFPEDTEDTLIRWPWIETSYTSDVPESEVKQVILGCDIAEGGLDWTVITEVIETIDGKFIVNNITSFQKADTMITVGKIAKIQERVKADVIKVDAIGVGKGVADRLQELGLLVVQVKVGMTPTRERERFTNQKAQFYWHLRTLFEESRIFIPKHDKLIKELHGMRYELTSAKKIKIIDPGKGKTNSLEKKKSPDFADSLMIAMAERYKDTVMFLDTSKMY